MKHRLPTMLLTVVFVSIASAGGAAPAPESLDVRRGQGERCLVCGMSIEGKDVVEVRYKGRTFHVAAGDMFDRFAAEPDRYFIKLQARSVLFDEAAMGAAPLSRGWLWFGLYVVAGLLCAAGAGYLALHRGYAPLGWFFAGLAGNVLALTALLVLPRRDLSRFPAGVPPGLAKVPATRSPIPCAACGDPNHPAAPHCSGCGADLTPTVLPETQHL